MIFGRPQPPKRSVGSERIDGLVRERLAGADEDALRVVVAVTGLLACIAYADREYSASEQALVRQILGRMQGLSEQAVEAICSALRDHIVEIAASNTQTYTRDLRELGEPELRREVLDALVDLAASDGELSMPETDLLRRTAATMGLSQDAYLESQSRYRERLSVLK
ncbi:MAG: TerB family tellurite resistance protein [Polyangiales bacterium]